MTASNTYRIAAAFQSDKDPQQDAVIAWLGTLPKDSRGGVKRSVMKYHLTRALLLYTQSGTDMSTALHMGSGMAPRPVLDERAPQVFVPAASPLLNVPTETSIETVKRVGGGLRGKIANSMSK